MSSITKQYFNPPQIFMEKVKTNLVEGDVFKNSKELCKKLDLSDISGVILKNHQAAWKSFFEYHKIEGTQKIMIDKIYENPMPYVSRAQTQKPVTEDDTEDKKEVYQSTLRKLMLDLVPKYGRTFTISTSNLLYELGFVNKEYTTICDKLNKDIDRETINSDTYNLMYLQTRVNNISWMYVNSTIKKLCSMGFLMDFKKVYLVKKEGEKDYHEATKEEITNIENYRNSLGRRMKRYFEFYRVNHLIKENLGLEIIISNKFVFNPGRVYSLLEDSQKHIYQNEINHSMYKNFDKKIMDSLPKLYDRYHKKYTESKELQSKYDGPFQMIYGKEKEQAVSDTKKLIERYCKR